ncbi:MAG: 50S ribosomal protein L2 [Candidatus Lokiarchaeota archaeon]|nr:50S ribosomal protein L2 [Candidatus Lokiarchaeota archaeon]
MGKRLRVQRKSSKVFRAPTHRRIKPIKYILQEEKKRDAELLEFHHEIGRGAPLGKYILDNKELTFFLVPEGVQIGHKIEIGHDASVNIGNVLPLYKIPEGIPIFNIEANPGDGGKFIRSSGSYATIQTRSKEKIVVKLKSGKFKNFHPLCRATIGIVAGGGRTEKPIVKAGNKFYQTRAKGIYWPVVRGVAMNACNHPHGGGNHQHIGKKGSCVSRNAPPGRKVGLIAARRSGRKKR